jgi:hypothetical protein
VIRVMRCEENPPTQIRPKHGSIQPYRDTIGLEWSWCRPLSGNEVFSVRVRSQVGHNGEHCVHDRTTATVYAFDRNRTTSPDKCPNKDAFCWNLQVVEPNGDGTWNQVSPNSPWECFAIKPPTTPQPRPGG